MTISDRVQPAVDVGKSGTPLGVFLAALLSATSITVLCYAAAGVNGNTALTGSLFAIYLAAISIHSFRTDIIVGPSDYLFTTFAFCIAASFAVNGPTADLKEWEIFAVSLAAYPACRFLSIDRLQRARPALNWTTGAIVALGTVATAIALATQWNDMHGKPIVGSFNIAATVFLASLGFLLISLSTMTLTRKRTALICAGIFVPAAVFAASQVRFTFAAIFGGLLIAAALSKWQQRKYVAIIAFVMLFGAGVGLVARSNTSLKFVAYAVEDTAAKTEAPAAMNDGRLPSCHLDINKFNSVAMRKAMIKDAFYLIPSAGMFGVGLDRFSSLSCVSISAHNSALQAFVEFGWLGGAALTLLVIVSLFRLWLAADQSDEIKFVLCSLAYIAAISLAHGRVSRDILLFGLLGMSAGIMESRRVR